MFETEPESEPEFLTWLIQQVLVPILAMIAAITIGSLANVSTDVVDTPVQTAVEVLSYIGLGLGIGFALALLVRHYIDKARITGRLVWILPIALLTASVIYWSVHVGVGQTMSEFFYPRPRFPGMAGEAWWAFLLVTYATAACIGYSLRMSAIVRSTLRTAGEQHLT